MNEPARTDAEGRSPDASEAIVILIVEPEDARADAITESIQTYLPAARTHRVHGQSDAWAYLSERAVDLVLVEHSLPDGDSLDLVANLKEARRALPVVVQVDDGEEDVVLHALRAGATDYIVYDDQGGDLRALPYKLLDVLRRHQEVQRASDPQRIRELEALLRTIRVGVSKVYHEINNPLAIISGNAQLLLELARMSDLDETLLQPIRDIEASSQRLSDLLVHLTDIRDTLQEHGIQAKDEQFDLPEA